jgi:hypothetical protein
MTQTGLDVTTGGVLLGDGRGGGDDDAGGDGCGAGAGEDRDGAGRPGALLRPADGSGGVGDCSATRCAPFPG